MKYKHSRLIFNVLITGMLLCPALTYSQQSAVSAPALEQNRDFWEKAAIAVIGAVLGFLGNYVLAQNKRRLEPRKEISFDSETDAGLVAVEEKAKGKVRVLYDGKEVRDLFSVVCRIENTGTSVIKMQYVRFALPSGCEILECNLDPAPQPELGVSEVTTSAFGPNEKRYVISHFEVAQKINIRFVVAGPHGDLTLHPFNDDGDVKFIPRAVSVASDEAQQIRDFIRYYLIYAFLPPLFYVFPGEIGSMAAAVVRIFMVLLLWGRLSAFVNIVTRTFNGLASLDELAPKN